MKISEFVHIVLVTCLCLVTSSHAWLFSRRYPSARAQEREVSEDCKVKAVSGSCDFYTCFEERLPCGKNWYNLKYGRPYCLDFKAFTSEFSLEGQRFINDTHSCMGRELMSWYEKERVNCHDFTHYAFKALSRCYTRNNFCQVAETDALSLMLIYRPHHLFSRGAFKIWREILRIAHHCDPLIIKGLIMAVYQAVVE